MKPRRGALGPPRGSKKTLIQYNKIQSDGFSRIDSVGWIQSDGFSLDGSSMDAFSMDGFSMDGFSRMDSAWMDSAWMDSVGWIQHGWIQSDGFSRIR